MRLFPAVPWYLWFREHDVAEGSICDKRYRAVSDSLISIFERSNLEGILFIAGDEGQEGRIEPLYLVKLSKDLEVLIHFDGSIGFSVTSSRPLSVDWMRLFDVSHRCGRQPTFSANSYSVDHSNFSGLLKYREQLHTLFFLLSNAK